MCKLKSVLILKDQVFCPDYDSHDEMLKELGIIDIFVNAQKFVRAEISPKDITKYSPVSEWEYRVDQDILPDWYVAEVDEARARKAVEEWANVHILTEGLYQLTAGHYYIYNSANVILRNSASAEFYDSTYAILYNSAKATLHHSASATLYNSANVILRNSANATLYHSANATLYGRASATFYDKASATLWDSAIGIIPIYSHNKGEKITLNGDAVLINHPDGIIKGWGKEIKR